MILGHLQVWRVVPVSYLETVEGRRMVKLTEAARQLERISKVSDCTYIHLCLREQGCPNSLMPMDSLEGRVEYISMDPSQKSIP